MNSIKNVAKIFYLINWRNETLAAYNSIIHFQNSYGEKKCIIFLLRKGTLTEEKFFLQFLGNKLTSIRGILNLWKNSYGIMNQLLRLLSWEFGSRTNRKHQEASYRTLRLKMTFKQTIRKVDCILLFAVLKGRKI